jgi:hypothetical protein
MLSSLVTIRWSSMGCMDDLNRKKASYDFHAKSFLIVSDVLFLWNEEEK